jgi:hypothetical protein
LVKFQQDVEEGMLGGGREGEGERERGKRRDGEEGDQGQKMIKRTHYGTLLIVDPEVEFYDQELVKFQQDVEEGMFGGGEGEGERERGKRRRKEEGGRRKEEGGRGLT